MKCAASVTAAALIFSADALSLFRPQSAQTNASVTQNANVTSLHIDQHKAAAAAEAEAVAAKACLKKPCGDDTCSDSDPKSICCKEPKGEDYTTYSGGIGPDKVKCCWKAKFVLKDVEYRCNVECSDAHPCNKALSTLCPQYIEHYTGACEEACGEPCGAAGNATGGNESNASFVQLRH